MSSQNLVLASAQFNELSSFINNDKLSLEKINQPLNNSYVNVDELVKKNNESNICYDSTNPGPGPVITFISSEKQWFICNSNHTNWDSNRDKLLSSFDLKNTTSFLSLLEDTQSIVAGGFAVNCLSGFDLNNYTGDMDIFLTKKGVVSPYSELDKFKQYFSENGYTLYTELTKPNDLSQHYTKPQECPISQQTITRVVEAYKSLHKIDRMAIFSKTIDGIQKDIQVIFTEYDCVKAHIRTFDMSVCQTFFDHKNLYTRFKYHILTLERVNVLLKNTNLYEDIKYLKRITKYQSRGFKTYFDINTPKILLNYDVINNLLEWKELNTRFTETHKLEDSLDITM